MTAIQRTLKILWLTIVAIVTVILAAGLVIQLPSVQTFIVSKAVEKFDGKLDADIRFEKIHLRPFRTLIIKDIEIIDRNPVRDAADSTAAQVDTFFKSEYITAKFSFQSLFRQESIHIDEVTVSNARMNLVLEDKPDEGDGDTSTDNLSRIFRLKKTGKKSEKEIFQINDVQISGMTFTMKNYGTGKIPYHGGINWDDLDVRDINLKASRLRFKAGIMYGAGESLSFREKSGYVMTEMSATAKVGRGKTIIQDLHIKDPWSDLHLPLYMMSYENILAFKDFISEVRIDAEIADSRLDFMTLRHFAPQLEGNSLKAGISGKASGYVDDFSIINLKVMSEAGGFTATVNGRMTGIPEIERTRLNAEISECSMTAEGLGLFLNEWIRDGKLDLSNYAAGQDFMVKAKVSGMMDSMDVQADMSSPIGGLRAHMKLDGIIDEKQPVSIKGTASTDDLNIGKIISKDIIGPLTMRTGVQVSLGDSTKVKIDSLFIDRLNMNRYDYTGIKAVGLLSGQMFNGTIIASDPNLNFILQGGFALSAKTKNSLYKFYANVSDANLNALNIDKRGKSRLRFQTNVNFTNTGDGNILGNIGIANLIFENSDGINRIGDINMTSHSSDNVYKIRLRAPFADGTYTGSAPVTQFVRDIRDITLKKEMPALFPDSEFIWNGNTYSFDFKTHNSMSLMAFLMPGAYIHEGTRVTLNIDKEGAMDGVLNSQRLAIGDNYIKDVQLSTDNRKESFSGDLSVLEFQLAGFSLANNSLKFIADNNHLGASYSYDNRSEQEIRGEIVLNSTMERQDDRLDIMLNLLPSSLILNSKEWKIQPSSITMKGKDITVDSLEVSSGEEKIYMYGSTSMTQKDTLNLNLERFDMSLLNSVFGPGLGLKGAATGRVSLTSPMGGRGLLAAIICDSTFISNQPLGIVKAGSSWNDEAKRFDIILRNELNGKRNIDLSARLAPKNGTLSGHIALDSLRIKYAEPFLTDVFSEMDGYVSGVIHAEGPVNKLKLRSRGTRLEGAELKIDFTNVPYRADGNFRLDENGVYFDDIRIRDRFDGSGTVGGSINWNNFQDMTFDTQIRVNNIEGVNLDRSRSEGFYGNIFGTGKVSITGPVNDLTLSVDAVTAKNGQLHIPMSDVATPVGKTDLLKFKEFKEEEYIDPYLAMRAKDAEKASGDSDLNVRLRVEASPNVEAFVEIDEATGNVLTGRGNGLIELEIGKDIFNINGNYTLTGGKYTFSAMGIVNRVFEIQDGSYINFIGDIMASTLNINALYQTKASLAPLLADEQSVTNRRTVQCGIEITDKLSNPRLGFSIDVPDLNPMIKSRVESALSTEDKVQKQFLSLLLSNSFLPDEQSGIANNTALLYSNVSEAMASQLSNIFHKLNIPVDLGLNYQPTEQGTNIFDVAVSTQLFNNRVIVNGNIGNKEYSNGGTQNDVVGDLDIEIKLNRSGALRLNLFSHSADLYSNYLDNSQRNGVGITYQREFNKLSTFLKYLFSNKARRREAQIAEEQSILTGERVEMKITREEYEKKEKSNGKR